MRLTQSRYLADGKGFNHGQPATLIHAEASSDFEALLENIARTGYYNQAYFESHSGQRDDLKIPHFWFIADLIASLEPRRVLEVGCGRGDLLWFLLKRGVEVRGVDSSADAERSAWPELRGRYELGELVLACARLASGGARLDTLCGLDVWEHLLPGNLPDAFQALDRLATTDALFFFVIPAFGEDRVFGERFPLEFEENRQAFDRREPFPFLLAERAAPPIPASGHLVWAHTEWWEDRFSDRGWTREVELERAVHARYDRHLPSSTRAFYVLSRGLEGRQRAALARARLTRPLSGVAMLGRLGEAVLRGHLGVAAELPALLNRLAGDRVPPSLRRASRIGVNALHALLTRQRA